MERGEKQTRQKKKARRTRRKIGAHFRKTALRQDCSLKNLIREGCIMYKYIKIYSM